MIGHHFELPGALAAVTNRHGGVSEGPYESLNLGDHVGDDADAVRANRDRVAVGIGVDRLTLADQQHGARVAVVDSSNAGAGHAGAAEAAEVFGATDALVTAEPGVALAVLVADCAPVVLWDPVRRVLAVAHCGRPGAVLDVVGAAVLTMTGTFGTDPGDLHAGVGPCVAATSYEVGPPEVAAVAGAFPDALDLLRPTRDGHAQFDLPGAVHRRLVAAGVPLTAITMAAIDTRTTTDTWFSDRAERPCGRFALVAAIDHD